MGATEESVRRSARVLAGYMSSTEADGFGTNYVVDKTAFLAAWQAIANNRPSLPPGFPTPAIEDPPAAALAHTTNLLANPLFSLNYPNAEIKMVELGKLIAMQHLVDCDASDGVHGARVQSTGAPDLNDLLQACLPLDLSPKAHTHWQQIPNGIAVYTLDNSYGVRDIKASPPMNVMQIVLGTNPNLMLVREHAGRYVLANGYHRAWMLRSRGAEMVPAVLAHVADKDQMVPPGFIDKAHVFGTRPPLVNDFFDDKLSVTTEIRSMVTMVKMTLEVLRVPRLV